MAQKMMKALLKDEPKEGYVLKEIPTPVPKPDEILFKVEKVTIKI
jgi:NADPH:quinone reductase-like Zn-dependent oxidoreductase